jgi:hypothetical protein
VGFIETLCFMQAADYGFADLLTMTFPAAGGQEKRRKAYLGAVGLIDRAKASGRLRADFTPEDPMLLIMASVRAATPATGPPGR